MTEKDPGTEMHKAMFMELILMLSSSAMQQLGKLINPQTGKTELNLEAAQATIDMLEMLESKTRGNLDRDEGRLLASTLTSLRMNYVETASQPPQAAKPESKPETAAPEAAPTGTAEPSPGKDPKFHKTYG
ncbi:MAG: DUF1844 domain-containing protein [bacterium]